MPDGCPSGQLFFGSAPPHGLAHTLTKGEEVAPMRMTLDALPVGASAVVTALRPLIGKQRPYDRYGAPPVGAYSPGKGKSMPSRHTASAAAIACAVVYIFPRPAVVVCMALLCALIGGLRVLSGQHDLSDVLAALALSLALSLAGYLL